MRTALPQSDASLRIRSITWRAKEDRSGSEYHQELLLHGLLQFQRQRLVQTLSVLEDKKFFWMRIALDCPAASPEEIDEDVEDILELLDSKRRFP